MWRKEFWLDYKPANRWRSGRAPECCDRGAHLDTTTSIRGSAKRNAAFMLQHGAMLTPRQPEGCVPVVVSRCAHFSLGVEFSLKAQIRWERGDGAMLSREFARIPWSV